MVNWIYMQTQPVFPTGQHIKLKFPFTNTLFCIINKFKLKKWCLNDDLKRHLKSKQNTENKRIKHDLVVENVKNVTLCLYEVSEDVEIKTNLLIQINL